MLLRDSRLLVMCRVEAAAPYLCCMIVETFLPCKSSTLGVYSGVPVSLKYTAPDSSTMLTEIGLCRYKLSTLGSFLLFTDSRSMLRSLAAVGAASVVIGTRLSALVISLSGFRTLGVFFWLPSELYVFVIDYLCSPEGTSEPCIIITCKPLPVNFIVLSRWL